MHVWHNYVCKNICNIIFIEQQQQVRAPTPPRLNLAAPIKRSIFEELEEEKEANLLIKTSAPSAVNMMMITVRKPKDDAGYTVRDYVQYQQQALQNQQQQQQQQKPSAIVLLHENIKPKATRQKQPLRSDIYVKPTSVSSANTAKIWQCLWIPVLFLLRIFMWLRSKWQKPKPNVKK